MVGLSAPAILLATGAVAGGLMAKIVDHHIATAIHDKIVKNLPAGAAGIIAVFDGGQRLGVEQALGGALLRWVVQSDKQGVSVLRGRWWRRWESSTPRKGTSADISSADSQARGSGTSFHAGRGGQLRSDVLGLPAG